MSKKLRRVLLDGARTGVSLGSGTQVIVPISEVQTIIKALNGTEGATEDFRNQYTYDVKLEGTYAKVVLRKVKGKYMLNLTSNPTSFQTGTNVYGYVEVDDLIRENYLKIIEHLALGNSVPKLKESIERSLVFLNNLEFATYTESLPGVSKKQVVTLWNTLWGGSTWATTDGTLETLREAMRVTVTSRSDDSSIGLQIHNETGGIERQLLVYDKELELKAKKRQVPEDVKNRLRLDLSLQNAWFKDRGILTVADLTKYKGDLSWKTWAMQQIARAVQDTLLFDMLNFDVVGIYLDKGLLEGTSEVMQYGLPPIVPPKAAVTMARNRILASMTPKQAQEFMLAGARAQRKFLLKGQKTTIGFDLNLDGSSV